jgi:ABC-type sugar transport system permease subunit
MSGRAHKARTMRRRRSLTGYLFMLPWILGFMVFTAFPFIATIILSFFDVKQSVIGYELAYTGINNYTVALLRNNQFIPKLIDFLVMEITYAPVIIVISFILALLLNRPMKGRFVLRMLFFLPVIVMSGPVMSQIMESGAASVTGLQNLLIFSMVASYSRPLAIALGYLFENFSMVLWFTGIPIILFINGLQKINGSVLEAAIIDAATPWQILWKITLPILRPIFLVVSIFTLVQLSVYTSGPDSVRGMIQDAIIRTVGGLGLASAFAWIYSLAILILIGIAFLCFKDPKDAPAQTEKRPDRRRIR